ncbi:MAG: hypothetical protein HYY01_02000 [Chloroflexi bacterium]|nr:hypothetical protein [Chloroflexota bacterium]
MWKLEEDSMWQVRRDNGVVVVYQSGILGGALAALIWGPQGASNSSRPLDLHDLKGCFIRHPPQLVITECDIAPAFAQMIRERLPGVPVYSVSPDRPVVMGNCSGLEWPLTSEQFVLLLQAVGHDPRALLFPPPFALASHPD